MTLLDYLHEECEAHGNLVVFRCTECGQRDLSLGSLHAHIERHRGYTRLGIQLPFTKTAPANVDELMKRTEVLRVDETSTISLEEVEEL